MKQTTKEKGRMRSGPWEGTGQEAGCKEVSRQKEEHVEKPECLWSQKEVEWESMHCLGGPVLTTTIPNGGQEN